MATLEMIRRVLARFLGGVPLSRVKTLNVLFESLWIWILIVAFVYPAMRP